MWFEIIMKTIWESQRKTTSIVIFGEEALKL